MIYPVYYYQTSYIHNLHITPAKLFTTMKHLVLDNGSYTIKAGYAGGKLPKPQKTHNVIVRLKDGIIHTANDYLAHLNQYLGMVFKRPHEQGNLNQWEVERPIWDVVFERLKVQPAETQLTLTETAFQLPQLLISTDQIVFEEYGFSEYFRCVPASLVPWTVGKVKQDDLDMEHGLVEKTGTIKTEKGIKEVREEEEVKELKLNNDETEPRKRSRRVVTDTHSEEPPRSSTNKDTEQKKDHSQKDTALTRGPEQGVEVPEEIPDFALVVDAGFNCTWIIPVIYQNVYWRGARKYPVGGRMLNGLLRETISFRHYDVTDESVLVNTIKEATCFVAKDYHSTLTNAAQHACEFVLPDFKTTTTGYIRKPGQILPPETQTLTLTDERFSVPESFYHPEILFNSSTANLAKIFLLTFKNLTDLVIEAVMSCPEVSRPLITANIFVVGGTLKLPNFAERLKLLLTRELPMDWPVRFLDNTNSDAAETAWFGGDALARAGTLGDITISKQEYFEHGLNWCQRQFGFKNV